jgi:hypothetical protein
MAKFHGKIGYAHTTETTPGVHQEVITERVYYGDIVQNRRLLREGDRVNPNITSGNSISIVADAYANEQYFAIRYVEWAGVRWTVSDVDVQPPVLSCVWGRCTMASRLQLQTLFEGITQDVYFQPPPNIQMRYPCIVYQRDISRTSFADNLPYIHAKRYQVTVIDRDPDSELPDMVEALPYCSLNRSFAAESLNHYVFTLFF